MVRRCIYPGCKDPWTLFGFNIRNAEAWKHAIGLNGDVPTDACICSRHFGMNSIGEGGRLKKNAIPMPVGRKNPTDTQQLTSINRSNIPDQPQPQHLEQWRLRSVDRRQVPDPPQSEILTKFVDHYSLQDKKQISDELRSRLSYIAKIC